MNETPISYVNKIKDTIKNKLQRMIEPFLLQYNGYKESFSTKDKAKKTKPLQALLPGIRPCFLLLLLIYMPKNSSYQSHKTECNKKQEETAATG